jgi:DNA recombination protein RmuC
MNGILLAIIVVLALLVLWQILQTVWTRREQSQLSEVRGSVQQLAGQAQNVTQQMGQLIHQVAQQLAGVNAAVQKGLADTALIADSARNAVSTELKSSQALLGRIHQQLGEFQELGRGMSQATQTLESILGGARTRGRLGELTLERLLEDCLPSANYSLQYRFSTGETADAVIHFRDKHLAIDSKFPLDDFRRLTTEGEPARRGFAYAVRGHAEAISKKYIVPSEGTLDIALMFVPSESVYYELLMTEDGKGQPLDEVCRSIGVIPVSPNTLYAYLRVILWGLQGMQIEENAKRLRASLAGLQKQLDTFEDVFQKLGTHLKNAGLSYAEAEQRLGRAEITLAHMIEGAAPDQLPLPAAEVAKNSG